MSVRVEGFKFQALQARMRKNIADAVNNAAESCVSLGQQLSPVDTGFMRDNIKQIDTATPEQLRAVVESGADYSVFVEYGTVNQDAQPFFTPAFESARRQLNNELLQVLR
jgi:HK97 gp10 family phage protein